MDVDLDTILAHDDVNVCWANWHSTFMHVMETAIPQVTFNLKTCKNLPWITKPIVQAIRRRNACFASILDEQVYI